MEARPLTPAATVVPLRDGPDGLEVLLLRRSSRGAFGGMWVFPGGKVESDDLDPDAPEDELASARRAAAREALEEADLKVDVADLVVLSHWIPPLESPRRFSTWFFLVPAAKAEVVVDGGEIEEHHWTTATGALARRDAGEIELAPPTFITLSWLAARADVAGSLAVAAAQPEPARYATRLGDLGGTNVTMWSGDAGYEAGDPTIDGPRHRVTCHAGAWAYEGPAL